MSLYNYKKFLGDSDKIVKKYFALKREAKEKENLRKIGLDENFQPVTSVIRKELEPFHNAIRKQKNKKSQKDTRGDKKEDEEGATEGERAEDTWGDKKEDEEEDDYLSAAKEEEELPNYGESLNFPSLQKLQSAYSKEEDKEKPEFYYAYKATVKNTHDYEENRDNFNNLTFEELKEKSII